ncbi:MAG: histidine kinase [unclassified Hahellaceae]|nr:histidine kinase [Hahellaceae bacterium]|tara:strand:+ start:92950 stop:95637 length:2688 start_codon:yes stop_codon:yes gene_type:complete
MTLNVDDLDFERCEDEPIHIPESIQGYGYLFALDRAEGKIKIVSENVSDLLISSDNLIGSNFFELLDSAEAVFDFLKETYHRAKQKETRLPVEVKFKRSVISPDQSTDYYAVVYDSDDRFVIELEPAADFRDSYSAKHFIKLYALGVAPKFKKFDSLEIMAQEIVDTIKYVTNMDRILLYRFNDDASGRVIAEAKEPDMESYLDVYYPASDIPPQARELYKKNWVRLTPNVDLEPSRLLPTVVDSGRKPLDLTHSILRTLSPIHRQYIRNQGLKASMSMSLVTHGNLWGIISCHSREATYIPQNVRLECEMISQLFSWHLYAKEEELYFRKKDKADQAISRMLSMVSSELSIIDIFKQHESEVLQIMEADGFVFFSEIQVVAIGATPDLEVIQEVCARFSDSQQKPYVSSDISADFDAPDRLNGIKGALFMPLAEKQNYYTVWFRKEEKLIQRWAGVPDEKAVSSSKRERLMPRTSFKVHIREISGKSKKWDQNDVGMAERFNRVFMAYALETQERMHRNLTNLEKQDRHKNEFLATLAHELRNPLTPISTGIAILEREGTEAVRERVIQTMTRQVDSMTRMIDDLMEVSRVTQGKIRLDLRTLAIQDVIRDALETCESLLKEKQHTIEMKMPDSVLFVTGDNTRLGQVFGNIINNAAKYTDAGGRIQIRAQAAGDTVSVKIIDNGVGLAPESTGLIFTMFTQMDTHSSRVKGGLGIGLTLVQKLVELHGGRIIARSAGIGQGAEFEVLLPQSQLDQNAEYSGPVELVKVATNRNRILVVDDNEDIAAMYEILLNAAGYDTKSVTRPRDSIELFKRFKPHFALLDIGMPDLNGYELCRILSALPEAEHTVFLSQSGWGNKEDVAKAYAAGFREHMVKPLNSQTLQLVLQKYAQET